MNGQNPKKNEFNTEEHQRKLIMDISEVMQKYEGKTLREAYLDFFFEIDPFGDHLDEILKTRRSGTTRSSTVTWR